MVDIGATKSKQKPASLAACGFFYGSDMPRKPLARCSAHGCDCRVVPGKSKCAKHLSKQRREYDKARPDHHGLYGHRWRKAREEFLSAHPLCVNCLNHDRVTSSEIVDHINPHRGDRLLFWDVTNWQALCKQCHDRKTATQDSAFAGGMGSQKSEA